MFAPLLGILDTKFNLCFFLAASRKRQSINTCGHRANTSNESLQNVIFFLLSQFLVFYSQCQPRSVWLVWCLVSVLLCFWSALTPCDFVLFTHLHTIHKLGSKRSQSSVIQLPTNSHMFASVHARTHTHPWTHTRHKRIIQFIIQTSIICFAFVCAYPLNCLCFWFFLLRFFSVVVAHRSHFVQIFVYIAVIVAVHE